MPKFENYTSHSEYRKKRSRLRFWIVLGTLFFLLACSIGLAYFVMNSPWLTVENFSAPDLPGVSASEMLNALKVQMSGSKLAALLGPDNILFWKLGGVPETVSKFPGVSNVSEEVDLFGRSVKLSAEPRKLWGVVCDGSGSNCYGVDESGIVFSRVPDVSGYLLLKIVDSSMRMHILGQPLFSETGWFSNIKSVIEAFDRNDFKVVSVELGNLSLREWTVRVANGPEFYFSLTFAPNNLNAILGSLRSKIDFNKTSYVDFRVPNRIYYK